MSQGNDRPGLNVEDVSAWVLRIGLGTSIAVMLIGTVICFAKGDISVHRIQNDQFQYRPAAIAQGIIHGHGKSVVDLGVYLLVLTPVLRVLMSMLVFAGVERDWTYAGITLAVLALTLAGLFWFG